MTEPTDATPSASEQDAADPTAPRPPAASYVSSQRTSDRPSPSPEGLTPEEQKHQRETSLVMSIVVIAAVVLGAVPLLYGAVIALFLPVLLVPWLVVPVLLTVLATTALRRAKRGGRRGPRITARWALGVAIALFALPLAAIAYFNVAMN
jgi:cation transport ATPase